MSALTFHAALYSCAALEEAARLYQEFADVRVRSGSPYHRVELTLKRSDFGGSLDELRKEFCNHALALMCRAGAPW